MRLSFSSLMPPRQTSGIRFEGGKTPQTPDNRFIQQPFPLDKTGSQKLQPWDIKLENFTNLLDTILKEKLCGLNK